jgi:hypothetical protein
MNVAVPCLRLLAAAALMILMPASAAAGAISPLWLLAALVLLTAASCFLQDFHRIRNVSACAASNALMLAMVYIFTLGALWLSTALQ